MSGKTSRSNADRSVSFPKRLSHSQISFFVLEIACSYTRAGVPVGPRGSVGTEPAAGEGRHHRRPWRPLWRPQLCRSAGETWGADDSSFGRRRHRLCLPTHARGAQGGRRVESVQDPLSAGGAIIGAFGALYGALESAAVQGKRGAPTIPLLGAVGTASAYPLTFSPCLGGRPEVEGRSSAYARQRLEESGGAGLLRQRSRRRVGPFGALGDSCSGHTRASYGMSRIAIAGV
jgi:hypothetical protein